ncbi:MAG: serine/threonine-protein kinase, partial [Gemmataceae bacterium]
MANPTTSVPEYCAVLSRSKLLPPAEVNNLYEAWRNAGSGHSTDHPVDSFRKFLVLKKYLTEYQAMMVQRGHAEGFYIGGYVILDRVGKGNMAGVYQAIHKSGQQVALKVLATSKARNPQMLGRFQREGRLLTQLNHPNIVRAYQIGTHQGLHYIAMEYLAGETVDEVIQRRQKLPPTEAARLAHQVLQGLQHLHERRMVHRDLKPANLMVIPGPGKTEATLNTLDATLKMVDIGLGRELFDDATGEHQHLTVEGTIVGTPDYLAPEQARDARTTDIRADIYSLGCVLYHLLAGRPPFSEKNIMATMVKHATEPVPPVTQFNPAVQPGLLVVLGRLLAKDPAGRYQTPGEAAQAIKPFLPSHGVPPSEAVVVPAFQRFLESEAELQVPPPPLAPADSELRRRTNST